VADILRSEAHGESVLARASSINQLSNVAYLADKEGLLWGKTLRYWKFILIPRFLWPGKPVNATGSWFAFKIDERRGIAPITTFRLPYHWSANMTPYGELFLNFGWVGMVSGATLLGGFYGLLWRLTGFGRGTNPLPFGRLCLTFFLIFGALAGLGADVQFVVNLIAFTLMVEALVWVEAFLSVKKT